MYIDVSLCSESEKKIVVEFFKIKFQSSICILLCFYKVVIFVYKSSDMLSKNTWGVQSAEPIRSNIANRQARPKGLILAEAKKL